MALAPWLRAISAVGTVAEATQAFRSASPSTRSPGPPLGRDASDLERGLANVVVAALKEAFDRDRTRFELERDERDAIRAQAERELRLERLRLVGMQAASQVRMLAVISVALWVASAAAAALLAPVPPATTWLMGVGWASFGGALAMSFSAHQQLTAWLAHEPDPALTPEPPTSMAQKTLPWFVVGGFVCSATSLLAAL